MANFFIISALNCQNNLKKRKIQARCPSLAYTGSRSNKLKTQEWAFEEQGLIFNLPIKRSSFTKYKAYPFNLKNDEKTGIFLYGSQIPERFSENSN